MSRVFPCCLTSPLTVRVSSRSCMSATASRGTGSDVPRVPCPAGLGLHVPGGYVVEDGDMGHVVESVILGGVLAPPAEDHRELHLVLDVGDPCGYDDLIEVERSDTGEIAAMTADAQRINTIARDAAYLAQKNFKALAEAGVKVPLGAFSGIEALSGFGPPVTFKLLPVGAAHCSFRSAFTSAGINQTRHAVYLDIVLDITVVLPAGTSEFSESAEVMIIESVLSGEVPDFILHSDFFG